ncbi:unnamed protein product [Phytophthora fragariaefolia]|uniref:Unnamed protein product n=1 Tax=Phytophthora fragariaefolia TaxID=1490495 RepID=A0A9W6XM38_9STRA|nr:unnamed protein product [Phytophthora fragariaefolia]
MCTSRDWQGTPSRGNGPYSSVPVSYKGNTVLLVWIDLFSGFVIVRAKGSRTAQTVAEAYEEAVFRRIGASEPIRQDREQGSCPTSSGRSISLWVKANEPHWRTDLRRTALQNAWCKPSQERLRSSVLPGTWMGPEDYIGVDARSRQHGTTGCRHEEVKIAYPAALQSGTRTSVKSGPGRSGSSSRTSERGHDWSPDRGRNAGMDVPGSREAGLCPQTGASMAWAVLSRGDGWYQRSAT